MSKRKKNTTQTSTAKTQRPPILSGRDAVVALKGKRGGKKRPWREQAAIINQEQECKFEEKQSTANNVEAKQASEVADTRSAPKAEKKMSALDAAAKILGEAEMPLNTKMIVERMIAQGLWVTRGRTPSATLYSAVIREIAVKGDQSRFKKTDRGLFILRKS